KVDETTLNDLSLAASYLDIKPLIDLLTNEKKKDQKRSINDNFSIESISSIPSKRSRLTKKFTINGGIPSNLTQNSFFVSPEVTNASLIEKIEESCYILLQGVR